MALLAAPGLPPSHPRTAKTASEGPFGTTEVFGYGPAFPLSPKWTPQGVPKASNMRPNGHPKHPRDPNMDPKMDTKRVLTHPTFLVSCFVTDAEKEWPKDGIRRAPWSHRGARECPRTPQTPKVRPKNIQNEANGDNHTSPAYKPWTKPMDAFYPRRRCSVATPG